MNNSGEFDEIIKCLPCELENILKKVDSVIKGQTFELKLRLNKPVALYGKYGCKFVYDDGKCTSFFGRGLLSVSAENMKNIIGRISEYSIYSKQNEINNGYLTFENCRAGLSGTAVYNDEKIINVTDFNGITLRIARNISPDSDEIFEKYIKKTGGSFIISGKPCSGKTTVLRNCAYKISTSGDLGYPKVTVIDERNEFSDKSNSNTGLSDVLKGYSKYDGIICAVRNLSPDYIICDEITTLCEAEKISQVQNTGVNFICSIHTGCIDELLRKDIVKLLLKKGSFKGCILLGTGENIGKCTDYYDCGGTK